MIPSLLRNPLEVVRFNARMAAGIGMLAVLIAVGILWYSQVEGWSVLDAAYMTVITFTTVGFSEVRPLDTGGRLFTMISPVFGVGLMLYILTSSVQMVVEGEFIRGFVRRRRMTTRLAELRDHYILCGYGRMGTEVARSFQAGGVPFVVVERDQTTVAEMTEAGILAVLGDATSDDVLRTAGVQRAKGLVASTGNDSDNVFIALSARGLNTDLVIVSRADAAETESKLLRAGATRVVSPYTIGGRRLALSVTRPLISDFYEALAISSDVDIHLEEIRVAPGSPMIGQSVGQVGGDGVHVLALGRATGEIITNPPDSTKIEPGDGLILLGGSDQLQPLDKKL